MKSSRLIKWVSPDRTTVHDAAHIINDLLFLIASLIQTAKKTEPLGVSKFGTIHSAEMKGRFAVKSVYLESKLAILRCKICHAPRSVIAANMQVGRLQPVL